MLPELKSDPILAVINRVDELICDKEHWGQGSSLDDHKRWCPTIAINFGGIGSGEQHSRTFGYFHRAIGPEGDSIPHYNDAPGRTFREIKALIAGARALRVADILKGQVLVVVKPGQRAL